MQRAGMDERDILEVLQRVLVEPVLTAHPTEANVRPLASGIARSTAS
jgi:phosphoenolpyruvate carboxylase